MPSIRPFCQKVVWELRGLQARCHGRTFKTLGKRFGQRRRLFVDAEANRLERRTDGAGMGRARPVTEKDDEKMSYRLGEL